MKNKEELANHIASLAQRAILYEVSTTPKPGLVDRDNSGSHKDMDFFTFMASSSVLYRGFFQCALEGLCFDDSDNTELLSKIRVHGIQCEKAMFLATNGVNTHKGIIFSVGILSAVIGNIYKKYGFQNYSMEVVFEEVKKVTKDLTLRDFKNISSIKTLTHGERLYKEYGYKGIRGEIESGFITVQKGALQIIRNWAIDKQFSMNDLFLEIIINLMAEGEDTNVIIRGGIDSLIRVKAISREFLEAGGMKQFQAKEKLENINEYFVRKNLSPGGAADLLAVSIFLGMIEGIIK
ncbi:triphosphoribosyl-dephospho-CoA synthase CitG [Clostridium sp.]|uniref:triphosphoribosyl-dephospho-CoA synthase CitG n=1 Tax=Clostridium sp. TaxID=1506 RepID=UPI001A484610|nr:triphosphoribosyl-dephospho-CoA synthase CitG [Clostridium sp.]MBK5235050.1 triphosphoribosyl-dephospho-CoA synthase CitG [Clostridium sp.]